MGVGINVENLNAWYGKGQALFDINLKVAANHATALIGPSGCGKSTFIRLLKHHAHAPPQLPSRSAVVGVDFNGTTARLLRSCGGAWAWCFRRRTRSPRCPFMTTWLRD